MLAGSFEESGEGEGGRGGLWAAGVREDYGRWEGCKKDRQELSMAGVMRELSDTLGIGAL